MDRAGERSTRIGEGRALVDGGRGLRFAVLYGGRREPAFAIRHAGVVRAYLNRCAHKGVELDWEEGDFFDAEGRLLVCATHGALYDPANGACAGGPCGGGGLTALAVIERDGALHLVTGDGVDLA